LTHLFYAMSEIQGMSLNYPKVYRKILKKQTFHENGKFLREHL